MSKISKAEVEKIASLARIKISEKEKEKYSIELSNILGYVDKLNKVNTENVNETAQVTGLENVYREDDVVDNWKVDEDSGKNTEKLLSNTKSKKDNYIKVKQVLN